MPEFMIPLLDVEKVVRGDIVRHRMSGTAYVVDSVSDRDIIAVRTQLIVPESRHEYLIMLSSPARESFLG